MTNQRRRSEQEDKEKGPTAELEDEEDHEEFNRQVQQAVQAMPVEERPTNKASLWSRLCSSMLHCIGLHYNAVALPTHIILKSLCNAAMRLHQFLYLA